MDIIKLMCASLTRQADSVFSGISTFGRLPYFPCLASDEVKFDIAFIGIGILHHLFVVY